MRINKYIAHQGWASRREADTLIEKGLVLVNGKGATIGQKIKEGDKVELTGNTKEKKYFAYYKGRGIITHSPNITKGEKDIMMQLKKARPELDLSDVSPIGRLDKDSEGLIILSNDGRITAALLDPDNGHEKEYDVILDKNVTNMLIKSIENGINIEGYTTKPAKAIKHPRNPRRLTIILTEGKKHQIRRMCAAKGYQVQSLKRTRIINIELGKLKPNQLRKIQGAELLEFLKTLDIQHRK